MNILMINYEYPPLGGGGGVFTQQLAEELSQKHRMTLITSQFAHQQSYEIWNHIEIFRVPILLRRNRNAATLLSMLSFAPASLWRGYRLLKARQFDLIHSMFAIPSAVSGFALAKAFHLPHILSILGGDVYDPSKRLSPHRTPLLHYTVEKMLAGSDLVIGMSSDIITRVLTHYNITRRIEMIPHGIKRPRMATKTREDLGYDSADILLVTVGRLVPRKAVHDLINVVQEVQNPTIKLIVIGDGPDRQKLEELAQTLHVADRVYFLGNVTDETKFQMLNIADIYVSSTQHEGFGLVFLEAMAVGLPIISYDNGGHVDFLSHNKTGFLVPLGDKHLLAQYTRNLGADPVLRRHMGQFNQRYVEDYYIETCARKYNVLYDSLAP